MRGVGGRAPRLQPRRFATAEISHLEAIVGGSRQHVQRMRIGAAAIQAFEVGVHLPQQTRIAKIVEPRVIIAITAFGAADRKVAQAYAQRAGQILDRR